MAWSQDTFVWPQGKRVAVSLSFDDARSSQCDVGQALFARCAARATFYVSTKRVAEQVDAWRQMVADGHEIGNHSLRHSCSGNFLWKARNVLENYTLEEMAAELAEANREIERLLGVCPESFAYPCGQTFVGRGLSCRSYVPVVAGHFTSGRGFRDEHVNQPAFCDLAKLGGTELDGLSFAQLVEMVERAAAHGSWVVFAGHDIGDRQLNGGRQVTFAEDLERFCRYCLAPGNGIWLDTVGAVAGYVRTHRRDPESAATC